MSGSVTKELLVLQKEEKRGLERSWGLSQNPSGALKAPGLKFVHLLKRKDKAGYTLSA